MDIRREIESASGLAIRDIKAASGGDVGQVYYVTASDGGQYVAKVDQGPGARLDVEGFMLRYLLDHGGLPVPEPLICSSTLLLMTRMEGTSSFSTSAQEHAADLLVALHQETAPAYGLDRPTLIGGLHQPNPWSRTWIAFFAEHRLLYMAEEAAAAGRLPKTIVRRVDKMAQELDDWLVEPPAPSLVHGDIWTNNVLAANGRITAFLDPAIYYGDPEVELAFITLFSTFGEPFFRRYREKRPLAPGFFETRRHIYNLYPLLVHSRLFGGHYVNNVVAILDRFGY